MHSAAKSSKRTQTPAEKTLNWINNQLNAPRMSGPYTEGYLKMLKTFQPQLSSSDKIEDLRFKVSALEMEMRRTILARVNYDTDKYHKEISPEEKGGFAFLKALLINLES